VATAYEAKLAKQRMLRAGQVHAERHGERCSQC
jgi:hypothetical protein